MKKIFLITALLLTVFISACTNKSATSTQGSTPKSAQATFQPSTQQVFFKNLKTLCGQVFTGKSTFPDDPEHDFAGKLLVANFASCEKDVIRIKFAVGEDHSRTWVLTDSIQGLLLKHDHRHKDGTPDEITMYGGWANDEGTVWRQHFQADKATADLIPEASTNVWMLDYNPETQVLTYDLERHDLPRFQAQLTPKN